jgi:hypothetical protein
MYKSVESLLSWPNMKREIEEYVKKLWELSCKQMAKSVKESSGGNYHSNLSSSI